MAQGDKETLPKSYRTKTFSGNICSYFLMQFSSSSVYWALNVNQDYPVPMINNNLVRLEDVPIAESPYPKGNKRDKTELCPETFKSLKSMITKGILKNGPKNTKCLQIKNSSFSETINSTKRVPPVALWDDAWGRPPGSLRSHCHVNNLLRNLTTE